MKPPFYKFENVEGIMGKKIVLKESISYCMVVGEIKAKGWVI